ncbi:hypothetical protein VPH35_063025 [Triticum aestivum]
MALTKSTTTRSTIVCLMVIAFLVLATICSTVPSCHALTGLRHLQPRNRYPMSIATTDCGSNIKTIDLNITDYTKSNKPRRVVCKTPDPCYDDTRCKAMCESSGMGFFMNICKGAALPECCCIEK